MWGLFIAGFLWATSVTVALAGMFFIHAWRNHPTDREYSLFAIATLFLAVHSGTVGGTYFVAAANVVGRAAWIHDLAFGSVAGAAAFSFHFASRYASAERKLLIHAGYAVCGVSVIIAASGYWRAPLPPTFETATFFGVQVPRMRVDLTWLGGAVSLWNVASITATCGLLIHAFVARVKGRENPVMVWGALMLLGTGLHDALAVGTGLFESVSLLPIGSILFVYGVATTLIARHARISSELAEKKRTLVARAAELEEALAELKRAQGKLLHSEQLAVVGEFATVITHEVRNPMTAVNDAVTSLSRANRVTDDTRTLLGIIEQEMLRLERLVTHLLSYARPIVPQKQPVALAALLDGCLTTIADQPEVTCEVTGDDDGSMVYVDREMMAQALDNIVANAVQAMDGRGELAVRIARRRVDGVNSVIIGFEDTGEGMTEHQLEQAMSPFYTTRPAGTGLGLAICERVVDAHGGMLVVSSERGMGTAVSVILPERPDEQLRTTRRAVSVPPSLDDV